MISNELLKQKVLDLAFSGKLVNNIISNDYYLDISDTYEKYNGGNRVKYEESINDFKYELPLNWKWVRSEEVCDTFGRIGFRGYTKKDLVDSKEDGAISLSPSNIINGKLDYSSCTYITWDKYNESPEIKVKNGDIVLVKTASVGKNAIVENLPHESTINPQCALLKNIRIVNRYLYYYLNTSVAKKHYAKFSIGTSVSTFSQGKINSILIPLCPLKEQKMIVKKIDELFDLIEQKEKNDQENKKLKVLLKEKILDSAIHGTLIKNDSTLKPIDVEEIKEELPFSIPSNWKWTYSKNITDKIQYGYTATSNENGNCRMLRITDIQHNNVNWDGVPRCVVSTNDMGKYLLNINDIVVARTGGTVGKNFLIKSVPDNCVFASYLIRMVPNENVISSYLKYYMDSELYWKQIADKSKGMAQPNVNGKSLSILKIPIPPLEEQKKIVEKIERLFELIEQL